MPFTHYPKLAGNVVCAWVQPPPPDRPAFLNLPRFSSLNKFTSPIEPGKSVVAHQDAQNFTRVYGTIASDQMLEVVLSFSNDETGPDGHWVTDDNVDKLNYDGIALRQLYDPARQDATGKYFAMIFGRWLRVEVKNTGTSPTKVLRVYARGSVF